MKRGKIVFAIFQITIACVITGYGAVASTAEAVSNDDGMLSERTTITLAVALTGVALAWTAAWKVQGFLKDTQTNIRDLNQKMDYLEKKLKDAEEKALTNSSAP